MIVLKDVNKFLINILEKDDVIVLGCSGGPDSMALMDVLLKLRGKLNLSIICAHVNHKLRVESDDEMVWLEGFCKENNVVFEKMIINNYGDDNFHNEARNFRYNFFEDLVHKYGAKYLMTAHHGDDLMETILMRIVRGSTLGGYAGFRKISCHGDYSIVRPLVYMTKDELLNYDKDNGIAYVVDKSNFSDKYTRNRYRKEVLPFLKREDSNVHLKFLRYSELLFECDDYLNCLTNDFVKTLYNDKCIDINKFKALDSVIQSKLINKLLESFYEDDMILITDVHTDLIKSLVYSNRANSSIYLPNAVNPEDFLNIHNNYVPEDMKPILSKKHKIIGYYGRCVGKKPFELVTDEGYKTKLLSAIYTEIVKQYPTESDLKNISTLITYIKNMQLSENEIN